MSLQVRMLAPTSNGVDGPLIADKLADATAASFFAAASDADTDAAVITWHVWACDALRVVYGQRNGNENGIY